MGAKTTSAKMSKGLPRYSHKTGRDFTECINGFFLSFLVHKIMQTNMTSNLGRLHLVSSKNIINSLKAAINRLNMKIKCYFADGFMKYNYHGGKQLRDS